MRIFGFNIHLPWERRKVRRTRKHIPRTRTLTQRMHLAAMRRRKAARRKRKVGFLGGIIRTVGGLAGAALNLFKPPGVRVMERLMKRHVALARRLKRRPVIHGRVRRIRPVRKIMPRRRYIRPIPRPVASASVKELSPAPVQRYVTVERRKLPGGGVIARVAPVMPMQQTMQQMPMQQPVRQPAQLAVRSEGGKSGGESNNLLPILAVAGGIAALMLLKKK